MSKKKKVNPLKSAGLSINKIRKKLSKLNKYHWSLMAVVSLILTLWITVQVTNHRLNVTMVAIDTGVLEFEPIQEVTQWHNREARFVYLTFNDGPSRNTNRIMDILESYDIAGTFFVLGSNIQNNPNSEQILNRMIEDGHYIGLHSMTRDPNYLYREENAPQNFLNEMLEVQKLVSEKTGGFESSLCRAPLGTSGTFSSEHIELISSSELNCWDWHIDARDWSPITVEDVMTNIETGMMLWRNPKQVVVLFQESEVAIAALPQVIEYYLNLGYEFLPYNPIQHFPVNFINNPDL